MSQGGKASLVVCSGQWEAWAAASRWVPVSVSRETSLPGRGPLNLMSTQSCLSSSSQTLSRKPHRVGSRGLGEPGQWISYVEKISIIYVFIIYFWLCWVFVAVQGLSLVAESGGSSLVAVCRLLIMVASRRRAQAVEHAGFRSCVHRPSCPVARGVFLDEGLNPCPLHKQVDSEPLDHQRNSSIFFLIFKY